MNPTLTKIIAGLVLFISGAVMGFFGSRLLTERGTLALLHGDSGRFVDMAMHRLSQDLELSEAQREKLRPLFLDTAKKLAELRREQEPKIHEIIEKSIEATKTVLTPEQLEKFEAIQVRLKQRREAMDRFGPPPPPPPGMDGFPPPPPPGMDGFPPPPGMGPPPDLDHIPGLDAPPPGMGSPPGWHRPPGMDQPSGDKSPLTTPGKADPALPDKAAPPAPDKTPPAGQDKDKTPLSSGKD